MDATTQAPDANDPKLLIPTSHYPLVLGDRLNFRYEILDKLGCSNLTSIWLARDHADMHFVTIKVFKAGIGDDVMETQVVTKLVEGSSGSKGRDCVSVAREVFTINSANGTHKCLVSEVAGSTLKESKGLAIWSKFPVNVARAIVAQVLLGMEYIHSRGVVHGALQMSNIIFKELDMITEASRIAEITSWAEGPKPFVSMAVVGGPVPRTPGARPPRVKEFSPNGLTDARVRIKEFSASILEEGTYRKWGNIPMASYPPELIFGEQPSQTADIWAMGCTIFEILGESSLFQAFEQDWDNMIAELVIALGVLPKPWWDRWEKRSEYFLPDGSQKPDSLHICMQNFRPLSEKLRLMGRGYFPSFGEFESEELKALDELLRGMLVYSPQERITAREAANSRWMENWGLKAIKEECVCKKRKRK